MFNLRGLQGADSSHGTHPSRGRGQRRHLGTARYLSFQGGIFCPAAGFLGSGVLRFGVCGVAGLGAWGLGLGARGPGLGARGSAFNRSIYWTAEGRVKIWTGSCLQQTQTSKLRKRLRQEQCRRFICCDILILKFSRAASVPMTSIARGITHDLDWTFTAPRMSSPSMRPAGSWGKEDPKSRFVVYVLMMKIDR